MRSGRWAFGNSMMSPRGKIGMMDGRVGAGRSGRSMRCANAADTGMDSQKAATTYRYRRRMLLKDTTAQRSYEQERTMRASRVTACLAALALLAVAVRAQT